MQDVWEDGMDRRRVLELGVASALAAGIAPAAAQRAYPSRTIRLVVPFPAGGGYDTIARPLAQALGRELGETIVVENKGGGETSIGAAEVARAEPDGYTLLFGGSPTHVFTPATMEHPTYDPRRDFAQIAITGVMPMSIAVSAKFPAKTLQELIDMAKAKPGELHYADSASSSRLAMELLKQRRGLDIVGVPYRGSAPAVNDTIAGHVQVYPGVAGSVSRLHRQGVLRVLAVLGDKRVAAMPDVPTTAEAGVSDLVLYSFNIVCAPARTPAPILQTLSAAINKVLVEPALMTLQRANGIEPVTDSTLESTNKFIDEQIEKLLPLIKAAPRRRS
jgi:tripartite-type tricarboxylate transporter receptor subunit TctC